MTSRTNLTSDPSYDDAERKFKYVRYGTAAMLSSNALISPSGIVITAFYPGICIASAIITVFTSSILLFYSFKKVTLSETGLQWAKASFGMSIFSCMLTCVCAAWSIYYAVLGHDDLTVYWNLISLVIGAGVLFLIHFVCQIGNGVKIFRSTQKYTPPTQYQTQQQQQQSDEPSSASRSTTLNSDDPLPQYTDLQTTAV